MTPHKSQRTMPQDLTRRMAEAYDFVKRHNDRQKHKWEQRLNEERKPHGFVEGVWLYTYSRKQGYTNKFKKPWQGPFCIHALVLPVTAKLYKLNGHPLKTLVNMSRLKKFYEPRMPEDHIDLDTFDDDQGGRLRRRASTGYLEATSSTKTDGVEA